MGWILRHLYRLFTCYGCRILPFCVCCPKQPSLIKTHRPKNTAEVPVPDYENGIRTLSFNTQLLLWHTDVKRAKAIAYQIIREDVHIVCLQEVFDEAARKAITEILSDEFPYHVTRAGFKAACGFGEDSGLMMFSKFPIQRVKFVLFYNCVCGLSDSVASKGALRADVKIGDSTVQVINTHLYASYMAVEERIEQIERITDYVEATPPGISGVVLMGDMNIAGDEMEYHSLFKNKNYRCHKWTDVFRMLKPDVEHYPGNTSLPPIGVTTEDGADFPSERLDYVFDAFDSFYWTECEPVSMEFLSDHMALKSRFYLCKQKKKQHRRALSAEEIQLAEEEKINMPSSTKVTCADRSPSMKSNRTVDLTSTDETTESEILPPYSPPIIHVEPADHEHRELDADPAGRISGEHKIYEHDASRISVSNLERQYSVSFVSSQFTSRKEANYSARFPCASNRAIRMVMPVRSNPKSRGCCCFGCCIIKPYHRPPKKENEIEISMTMGRSKGPHSYISNPSVTRRSLTNRSEVILEGSQEEDTKEEPSAQLADPETENHTEKENGQETGKAKTEAGMADEKKEETKKEKEAQENEEEEEKPVPDEDQGKDSSQDPTQQPERELSDMEELKQSEASESAEGARKAEAETELETETETETEESEVVHSMGQKKKSSDAISSASTTDADKDTEPPEKYSSEYSNSGISSSLASTSAHTSTHNSQSQVMDKEAVGPSDE